MRRSWLLLFTGPALALFVAVSTGERPWPHAVALTALIWWAIRLNRKGTKQ